MLRKAPETVADVYDRPSIKKNCTKLALWIIKNMSKQNKELSYISVIAKVDKTKKNCFCKNKYQENLRAFTTVKKTQTSLSKINRKCELFTKWYAYIS